MGVFITIISLSTFLTLMAIYKICQSRFLQCDKSRVEESGFLSDGLLSFLEFAILVVTFLLIEDLFIGTGGVYMMKLLFIFIAFGLFVTDDILLYRKRKK